MLFLFFLGGRFFCAGIHYFFTVLRRRQFPSPPCKRCIGLCISTEEIPQILLLLYDRPARGFSTGSAHDPMASKAPPSTAGGFSHIARRHKRTVPPSTAKKPTYVGFHFLTLVERFHLVLIAPSLFHFVQYRIGNIKCFFRRRV